MKFFAPAMMQAEIKLLSELAKAEEKIKTGDEWKSLDDLRKALED